MSNKNVVPTKVDWGFYYLMDSELEALRLAYSYRHNPHGFEVKFAEGAKQWMVTIFNEFGGRMIKGGMFKAN